MEMPVLLAIDTATSCSAIALCQGDTKNGNVLASLSFNTKITHSRRLLSSIDYLMKEADVTWNDLSGVIVGLGPGSFTGLRIGMATAKGLAMAANISLLGVSTLDVLASRCVTDKLICATLDARKKEVYSAFYRRKGGRVERISDLQVIAPSKLLEQIKEPVVFVGDGCRSYGEVWLEDGIHEMAPAALSAISGESLGLYGGDLFKKRDFLDPATAIPFYVRASDAELNLGVKIPRQL